MLGNESKILARDGVHSRMKHHAVKNIHREERRKKAMVKKSKNNSKRLREYNPDNSYTQPKIGDLL